MRLNKKLEEHLMLSSQKKNKFSLNKSTELVIQGNLT